MAVRAEDIAPAEARGLVDLARDRSLVVRHQRGEDQAFDELYRRYHLRLVAFCQRRVGDRHTAEELAQEAFVRALRAMPNFAGERHFYPWMTVIARRLCIDHHRRNHRVQPAAVVDAGVVEPDHDALWDAVEHRHLELALARLAPRHREILELREQRGWSYQQIAESLDVPITTIEALLHRARKALRREYAAVAGEDHGGRLVAAGGLTALLARAKGWIAALGTERWVPGLAAAVAGVGAVGLVVAPHQIRPEAAERLQVTEVEPAAAVVADPDEPAPPAEVAATTSIVPTTATPAPPATAEPALPRPEPATEIGPVAVFADEPGQAYVDEQVDGMPIIVDVLLIRLGIDPAVLLGRPAEPMPPTPGEQP